MHPYETLPMQCRKCEKITNTMMTGQDGVDLGIVLRCAVCGTLRKEKKERMDITVINKLFNHMDDLTHAVKRLQKSIDEKAVPEQKPRTRYCSNCRCTQTVGLSEYTTSGVPIGFVMRVLYCGNCNNYLDEEIVREDGTSHCNHCNTFTRTIPVKEGNLVQEIMVDRCYDCGAIKGDDHTDCQCYVCRMKSGELSTTIRTPSPKIWCTECSSTRETLTGDLVETGMIWCDVCHQDTLIKALRARDDYAFCQHCKTGTRTGETVKSRDPLFVTEARCFECGRLR